MTVHRISGVWKNTDGVITAYAFHTVLSGNTVSRVNKTTKAQAISILETPGNSATTWIWNYQTAIWNIGETVTVVGTGNDKYLRSNPDNKLTDNLGHLVNFDWIAP